MLHGQLLDEKLVQAAKKGKTEEVARLIKAGADVHAVVAGSTSFCGSCTPMSAAIENGKHAVVALLVQNGVDPDQPHLVLGFLSHEPAPPDRLPLVFAAALGKDKVVDVLLAAGSNVDAKSRDRSKSSSFLHPFSIWQTALHLAAQQGHAKVALKLIQADADVNALNEFGETPLHCAVTVYQPHPSNLIALAPTKVKTMAGLLIAAGSSVNRRSNCGASPLYRAAEADYSSAVTQLITAGADVDLPDHRGLTPLHRAAEEGLSRVIALLAKAGADLDKREFEHGSTPLCIAAQEGNHAAAAALVRAGADVNHKTDDGSTPLYIAVFDFSPDARSRVALNGRDKVIELLLASGADPDAIPDEDEEDDEKGTTPLFHVVPRLYCHYQPFPLRIFTKFLRAGATTTAADGKTTVLHEAARMDHTGMVRAILTPFLTVDPERWHTFLVGAVRAGKVATAVAAGVQPPPPPAERSLLAMLHGDHLRRVYSFVVRPTFVGDLDAKDKDGWTAAQYASHCGHARVVDQLRERGAAIPSSGSGGAQASPN